MLRLATGMQNKAFTLLEILIVIVIMGIVITFAVVAFGDFGERRSLITYGDNFINHVKLAQQEAVVQSATFGINVQSDGYQILRFDNKGWQKINKKPYLFQKISANASLVIDKGSTKGDKPAIVINVTGDITPFIVSIKSKREGKIMTIAGTHDGQIVPQYV